MSRNVVALTYLKNFTGQRDGTGRPGKRQKLVPGQTFGKEREIAVTIFDTEQRLKSNVKFQLPSLKKN